MTLLASQSRGAPVPDSTGIMAPVNAWTVPARAVTEPLIVAVIVDAEVKFVVTRAKARPILEATPAVTDELAWFQKTGVPIAPAPATATAVSVGVVLLMLSAVTAMAPSRSVGQQRDGRGRWSRHRW